jgi:hypothetical protein
MPLSVEQVAQIGGRAMGGHRLTNDERRDIESVYEHITGTKMCSTCPERYHDAVVVARLHIKNQISLNQNHKTMSRFKLKPNRVIKRHGEQPLTNANLSDEKAIALLRKSRTYATAFAVLPAGWEQEIFGDAAVNADADTNSNTNNGGSAASDTESEFVKELKSKTFDELVKIAEAEPEKYPKAEWQNKNRKALIKYLSPKE